MAWLWYYLGVSTLATILAPFIIGRTSENPLPVNFKTIMSVLWYGLGWPIVISFYVIGILILLIYEGLVIIRNFVYYLVECGILIGEGEETRPMGNLSTRHNVWMWENGKAIYKCDFYPFFYKDSNKDKLERLGKFYDDIHGKYVTYCSSLLSFRNEVEIWVAIAGHVDNHNYHDIPYYDRVRAAVFMGALPRDETQLSVVGVDMTKYLKSKENCWLSDSGWPH